MNTSAGQNSLVPLQYSGRSHSCSENLKYFQLVNEREIFSVFSVDK